MTHINPERYFVAREGLRWRIFQRGYDGINRPMHPIAGRFWRWITAARIASELNHAHIDGHWLAQNETVCGGR